MGAVRQPIWLDTIAKEYWSILYRQVRSKLPGAAPLFAVLCQSYSDYRKALDTNDTRQKKIQQEFILKYSKELGITYPNKNNQKDEPFVDILRGRK